MNMKNGDWDILASELVRQNYAFVSAFSVILWDCLTTFNHEVRYIWHCPSRTTKCLFLFSWYYAMGYLIACSTFGTQWMLRHPTSRNDCVTWVLIHEGSLSLLYLNSQLLLVRKVFNLYGRSILLATGLFALHCIQVAGSFVLSHQVSGQLNFDPICNSRNVPNSALAILVSLTCNQCITWALVLRKVRNIQPLFLLNWRRYLHTSEAHVKLSWGFCLVAILLCSSHSLANQRLVNVYTFTIPVIVVSIGTCRFILSAEKDRDACAKLAEAINTAGGKEAQSEEKSHREALPTQNRYRHSYPPRPQAATASPPDSEASSIQNFSSDFGSHNLDAVVSNFPYLHGVQSYILKAKRNRSSMGTTMSDSASNHSPRTSSDCGSQCTASVRTSWDSRVNPGPPLRVNCAVQSEATDAVDQNTAVEHIYSASHIEIGSLHSSSSVNSEELRRFYNET